MDVAVARGKVMVLAQGGVDTLLEGQAGDRRARQPLDVAVSIFQLAIAEGSQLRVTEVHDLRPSDLGWLVRAMQFFPFSLLGLGQERMAFLLKIPPDHLCPQRALGFATTALVLAFEFLRDSQQAVFEAPSSFLPIELAGMRPALDVETHAALAVPDPPGAILRQLLGYLLPSLRSIYNPSRF